MARRCSVPNSEHSNNEVIGPVVGDQELTAVSVRLQDNDTVPNSSPYTNGERYYSTL